MFLTIQKRLELLIATQKKVENGEIRFDPEKANFGFKRMEQLFPVVQDEIKGYPCVAYDKFSDPIKYGVKVIPLELKYENATHPCRIEIALLQEFTKMVNEYNTPHITYFFKEMSVPNKKKVLTRFPLKTLRKEIFKESNVLIAEYVPGGSIEEWIQEQPNITEKQWKYIIFSVAWTLLVLQDRYSFMHNDFHYGNILIDTSIDPMDKSFCQYTLKSSDSPDLVFNVQNVGLLPKLWDFEFATTYSPDFLYQNDFFKQTEENIPHEFNPFYDLHCFLTSLLELAIPDKLRELILEFYPEEILPPVRDVDDSSYESDDESSYSDDTRTLDSSDSYCSGCRYCGIPEEFYKTDESSHTTSLDETSTDENSTNRDLTDGKSADSSTSITTSSRHESKNPLRRGREKRRSFNKSVDTTTENTGSDFSSRTDCSCDRCLRNDYSSRSSTGSSMSYDEDEDSRIRTDYMLGDRMLNGTEKLFKLPSPLDILRHDYFSEYRKPLRKMANVNCKFSYQSKGRAAPYQPLPSESE